jgi:hypothetical protein
MTLRVIDSAGNYDEVRYIIHVLGSKPKEEKTKKSKFGKIEKIEKKIAGTIIKKKKSKKLKMMFYSSPSVLLQGKSGKKISNQSYICKYKKKPLCSVNFTLS